MQNTSGNISYRACSPSQPHNQADAEPGMQAGLLQQAAAQPLGTQAGEV